MDFKHILVTTDFSDDSLTAFTIAAKEAKAKKCKVSLLAVVNDWDVPPVFMQDIANPEAITKYRHDLADKAKEKLSSYVSEYFRDVEVDTHAKLAAQPVDQVIIDFANEHQCDLIVISSHGRGSLGNLLLGSVVQKVIRHSPCPVMVIPKKEK